MNAPATPSGSEREQTLAPHAWKSSTASVWSDAARTLAIRALHQRGLRASEGRRYSLTVGGELDPSVLSDQELRDRIQVGTAQSSMGAAVEPSWLDAMRSELVRRLRIRHEAGHGDSDGADDAGVREPRRPTPPAGTDAIQVPATDDNAA